MQMLAGAPGWLVGIADHNGRPVIHVARNLFKYHFVLQGFVATQTLVRQRTAKLRHAIRCGLKCRGDWCWQTRKGLTAKPRLA